jgi:hypothetical protein
VSFDMYNDYNIVDRTEAYLSITANPALYFIDPTVLKAAAYGIYSAALDKDMKIGAVGMSREVFWNYEVNGPETTRLFKNYIYPVKYKARLMEVSQYARQHGIQLVFVIFPTHTDFQARFAAFGLEPQKQRLTKDLASINTVYDFDYPNAFTGDANNFRDPLHLTASAVDEVAVEIWGNHGQRAHRYQ